MSKMSNARFNGRSQAVDETYYVLNDQVSLSYTVTPL